MEIIMLAQSLRFWKWILSDKSECWTSVLAMAFGICVKSLVEHQTYRFCVFDAGLLKWLWNFPMRIL